MPSTDPPLTGDALLTAVTEAMCAVHERYRHRPTATAKTTMPGDDDLLACVMGGIYTDVEKR